MRALIGTSKLKAMSDKRRAKQGERLACVKQTMSRANGRCEAGVAGICTRFATDTHEFKSRGQGGDPHDIGNTFAVCRACHDFIHNNPEAAFDLGLLDSNKIAARRAVEGNK